MILLLLFMSRVQLQFFQGWVGGKDSSSSVFAVFNCDDLLVNKCELY